MDHAVKAASKCGQLIEAARKFREAEIIREFEVGILMEVIGKVFG